MKPYFDTNHLAGPLLLIVTMGWGAMELGQFSQGLQARKGATKVSSFISRRASSRRPRSGPAPAPSPPGW
jgi:hypothetical protein